MKICYLANAASIHTKRWAEHFASIGNQVFVVSFDPGQIPNVPVIHIPSVFPQRHINVLMKLPKTRKIIHKINPDIVHAHYVTSYGIAGATAGMRPLVLSAWGSDVLVMPEQSRVYRLMVRVSMRKADLVTSIAEHMTRLIIKRKYTTPEKIITFPFGVDTDFFYPRKKPSDGQNSCVVVSNRRLDTGLDVDVFIRSIPEVLAHHPETKFIVAGDGPLRNDLETHTRMLGLSNSVSFIGSLEHSQMPEFLAKADVFVSTSRTDGNNISLNEAMACGTFPIATDIEANRNWIENGHNGFLFPCRNESALSLRIIGAIEKPELRHSAAEQNWKIIQSRASWKREMAKMETIYQELLDSNPVH